MVEVFHIFAEAIVPVSLDTQLQVSFGQRTENICRSLPAKSVIIYSSIYFCFIFISALTSSKPTQVFKKNSNRSLQDLVGIYIYIFSKVNTITAPG